MSQKKCTSCGAVLSEEIKFCQQCGLPVESGSGGPDPQPVLPVGSSSGSPPVISASQEGKDKKPAIVFTTIFLALVIAAGVFFFVLPYLSGADSSPVSLPDSVAAAETSMPVVTTPGAALVTPSALTQKSGQFPDALELKERHLFGSEKVASEAIVYRYWINDTYEWHNDMDNNYYIQKPRTGDKYLFVFVHLQNNGDTRVWFPPAGSVIVYYNGVTYTEDQNHYKPDKLGDKDATPVEVKEIQYFQKLNEDEYVEDFGFSHGAELAYLYPGGSNAVDGYIVYEVPQSLIPEETYVGISFNAKDQGVWKLG